jgi:hypothetical protein
MLQDVKKHYEHQSAIQSQSSGDGNIWKDRLRKLQQIIDERNGVVPAQPADAAPAAADSPPPAAATETPAPADAAADGTAPAAEPAPAGPPAQQEP